MKRRILALVLTLALALGMLVPARAAYTPEEQYDLLRYVEDLIRELSHLPEEIRLAAAQRDPSRLNRYVTQAATAFHKFYTECRIKEAEPAVRDARILLCQCTAAVIENTLSTFGVSAPDHM